MAGVRRVTLREVSERAKVSPMTASRVLNRLESHPLVKESTRKVVLAAAKELGYTPNGLAQAMRTGRTGNVGVIMPARPDGQILTDTVFYAQLIEGLEHGLLKNEHNVLIGTVSPEDIRWRRLPRVAAAGYVDALVFLGVQDRKYVEAMVAEFAIVLALDSELRRGCPCVYSPHREAAVLVAQHLWDQGHRCFGVITDLVSLNQNESTESFREHVRQLGGQTLHVARTDAWASDSKGGYGGMQEILALPTRPTAVFCTNDHLAIHSLKAIRDAGLTVPHDMSVVGFDNIDVCEHSNPPLTTIGFDRRAMGVTAATMILQMLGNQPLEQDHVAVPIALVERQSVGKCEPANV